MPYAIIGIAILAAGCVLAGIRRKRKPKNETEDIDGGITKYTDTNAPKVIESELIISFECELSTLADAEDDEYSGKNYKLYAKLRDGAVVAKYEYYDRMGNSISKEFRSSVEFMRRLYGIVSEYDLAQYNGCHYHVAGLPDMYGADIDIVFASGESIRASNNQENFLNRDAVRELVELFEEYAARKDALQRKLFGGNKEQVESVESMTLTLRGMRGGTVYKFDAESNHTELRYYCEKYSGEETILELERSIACDPQTMICLMNTCDVIKWNGFHGKHPKNVHDGIMFRFEATVNEGQTILADGSENFPKGYREFVRTLDEMLSKSTTNL